MAESTRSICRAKATCHVELTRLVRLISRPSCSGRTGLAGSICDVELAGLAGLAKSICRAK